MYIKVIATPSSKKASIKKLADDHYEISVREEAEFNQANKAIIQAISAYLNVPAGKIKLVTGHHSRHKIFDIVE